MANGFKYPYLHLKVNGPNFESSFFPFGVRAGEAAPRCIGDRFVWRFRNNEDVELVLAFLDTGVCIVKAVAQLASRKANKTGILRPFIFM